MRLNKFKRAGPRRISEAHSSEPLSVLKPVHGEDAELESNLETFFEQDYPDFELIFCARTLQDDALEAGATTGTALPKRSR